MGLPTKVSFLHIAMSVLLLCEVTLLIDAARGYYPGKRPSASAYRFRREGTLYYLDRNIFFTPKQIK